MDLDLRVPMRLFRVVRRLYSKREEERQVARANVLLPSILAQAARNRGEGFGRGQKVISTVTDVTVVTLGQDGGPAQALLKLANSRQAADDLRNQSQVLVKLRADPRLGNWTTLLPSVLAEGQVEGQYYVIETALPGMDARQVVNQAGTRSRMLAAAAETIGELHARTASMRCVNAGLLSQWIDRYVGIVRASLATSTQPSSYAAGLDKLADELYCSLDGRKVPVGWIHGDFDPGNLLVSPRGAPITGIVDWGLASPEDLPVLDLIHMLLSTRMYLQGRELGDIVRHLLDQEDWTKEEIALLDSGQKMFPSQPVDMRSLLLLAWLRHIGSKLSKCPHYRDNWLWVHRNVKGVLVTIKALPVRCTRTT